jgi:hypothetical protein
MSVNAGPKFELRSYSVDSVRLRLRADDGTDFIIDVSTEGLSFFVDESSAGNSQDKPILKSTNEIWEWVKNCGDKIPLKDREEAKRSRGRNAKVT